VKRILGAVAVLLALGAGWPGAGFLAGATAADAAGPAAKRDKVSILLNWFPEAEHGGFYAALVSGEYEKAGLDVTIIPGGVDVPVTPRVAGGQADFGVANADQVAFARDAGANVVALIAPLQVSPRCMMVHASQGFRSLADLNDMTLAISPKDAFAEFMRQRFPLKNVKIVPYPGSVAPFLNDPRFGQQAYNISEPFVAKQAGGDPQVLMLADAGYNPYTSCLVTRDEMVKQNPDLVRRVVQATQRGWELYLRDPAAANAKIRELNPEMSAEILKFGVDEMQGMAWLDPAKKTGVGEMTLERWRAIVDTMVQLKLVTAERVKPEACFTREFLAGK
jgi:NitT/TauT family transport system substrate-binding protein